MRRFGVLFALSAAASFAADPELLRLVSPDARVLAGINVTQVKKTPFGRFALAEFSASQDEAYDGFVKASGFDPRTNLDEILMATSAVGGSDRKLIAARGTFAPARILELARSAGATVDPYQGVDVISSGASTTSPQGVSLSFAFLSDSLAVAGDPASVHAAIDRRSAGGGPGPKLAPRVNSVSTTSDAWFVSSLPVAELIAGLPGANLKGALEGDALKSIEQASGGAVFGDAVKVSAELVTQTAEDAANLAVVIKFLSGLAESKPGAQQALLSGLNLKAEGKLLKLVLAIPEAQLETFIRQSGQ
jgi:hypothetical protein